MLNFLKTHNLFLNLFFSIDSGFMFTNLLKINIFNLVGAYNLLSVLSSVFTGKIVLISKIWTNVLNCHANNNTTTQNRL